MLTLSGFTWYTSTANDLQRFMYYNSVDLYNRAQHRLMRKGLVFIRCALYQQRHRISRSTTNTIYTNRLGAGCQRSMFGTQLIVSTPDAMLIYSPENSKTAGRAHLLDCSEIISDYRGLFGVRAGERRT
jgi:hypothetical protein